MKEENGKPIPCQPPRRNHVYMFGQCMFCGVSKRVVAEAQREAARVRDHARRRASR